MFRYGWDILGFLICVFVDSGSVKVRDFYWYGITRGVADKKLERKWRWIGSAGSILGFLEHWRSVFY